jgi:hypothetical protein
MNRFLTTITLLVAVLAVSLPGIRTSVASTHTRAPNDPVILAHYYIWFDATSWNRAKSDFPAIGRYSSDQSSAMREHVVMAKRAGIDGFIVSWKSTAVLDRRLEQLIAIAEEEDFKLAITYQGLDFNRDPLPSDRIAEDLDILFTEFTPSPVFDIFGRPLVVLTGTWEFTADDLDQLTESRRADALILASEKNVEGYRRVAPFVDGNLYYWSSVNPDTHPDYPQKLERMGSEVRANEGIWIAPVAPGFDARLVGGTQVVERDGGDTLRAEWQAALSSLPDAVGIISWNEFSENTHIEPSVNYRETSLSVVADLTGSPQPSAIEFDSSAPEGPPLFNVNGMLAFVLFIAAIVGSTIVVYRRRPRATDAKDESDQPDLVEPGSDGLS